MGEGNCGAAHVSPGGCFLALGSVGGGGGWGSPTSGNVGGRGVRASAWTPTTTAMDSCAPSGSPGRMYLIVPEGSCSHRGFSLGRSSGLAFPYSMDPVAVLATFELYRADSPASILALSSGGSRSAYRMIANILPRILVMSAEVYVCLPGRPSPLAMMTMCAMVPRPQSNVNGPCFGEGQ